MQIHTRTLSAGQSLSITQALNVLQMSIIVNDSSTGTATGDLTIGGVASTSIALSTGQGFSISTSLPNNPIFGITVTCSTGTIDVMLAVQ